MFTTRLKNAAVFETETLAAIAAKGVKHCSVVYSGSEHGFICIIEKEGKAPRYLTSR